MATSNNSYDAIILNRYATSETLHNHTYHSPTRRVLIAVVEGRRQGSRPKLRWEDGVMEDATKLGGEKLEEYCKE